MRWNTLEGLEPGDFASLLGPETHRDALTLLAAAALQRGQHHVAFLLADRRCRIDLPQPEHLLLRAEASKALGRHSEAIRDIKAALEIEPDHLLAMRRALAWGPRRLQSEVAARLLMREDDIETLLVAIRAYTVGPVDGVASFKAAGQDIEGWIAWRGQGRLLLRIAWANGDATLHPVDFDPAHPLRHGLGHAASIRITPQSHALWAQVDVEGASVRVLGCPVRFPKTRTAISTEEARSSGAPVLSGAGTSIIIPVYEDAAATSACLSTVLAESPSGAQREIIVVDDHSPNPRIKELLVRLNRQGSIRLITHSTNLGFVDSVNHALAERIFEDVILLNSDTVAPPEALHRLIEAARSSDDIATATPFSNNGEFTSFPEGFVQNPMSSRAETWTIDAAARCMNALETVAIPNGTGFCMAIRGDIFRRFGGFEAAVEWGYLEDVDFCLKASAAGYRNVCATGIYVAHKGSRSFRDRKRSLVMRNMPLIEQRYPSYRSSCAAFMKIDPLQPARERIEREVLTKNSESFELFVMPQRAEGHPVQARVRSLASRKARILVAEIEHTSGASTVRIFRAGGGIPQNLHFAYGRPKQLDEAVGFLRGLQIKRVEFADPSALPAAVIVALRGLGVRHDVWMAEGEPVGRDGERRPIPELVRSARKTIMSSPELARVLGLNGNGPQAPKRPAQGRRGRAVKPLAHRAGVLIGAIPLDTSTRTLRFLVDFARNLKLCGNDFEIIVLGGTYDDLRVLAIGNGFVTGPVRSDELESMLAAIRPSHLFALNREPVFGHESQIRAMESGYPVASFDWQVLKPTVSRAGNLLLPPEIDGKQAADLLSAWSRKAPLAAPPPFSRRGPVGHAIAESAD